MVGEICNVLILQTISPLSFISLQSGLTLSSDGILGPLGSDLPAEGLDLSDEVSLPE